MVTALLWILTPILILDCLLLGLLVLIQLPKKEAGAGMAFGGGATDALFGAGSGTALTKLTKYTAGIFFALVMILSILNVRAKNQGASDTMSDLRKNPAVKQSAVPPTAPSTAPMTAPALSNTPADTGGSLITLPMSNAPAMSAPASNATTK